MDIPVIWLWPNVDAGTDLISKELRRFRDLNPNSKIQFVRNFSPEEFITILNNASCIIGNSSSGIHETPTFKIPAINIGNRQMGRERAANVIDVQNNAEDIEIGLRKALYDNNFREFVSRIKNPYGEGDSASKIVYHLKNLKLEGKLQKVFYEG